MFSGILEPSALDDSVLQSQLHRGVVLMLCSVIPLALEDTDSTERESAEQQCAEYVRGVYMCVFVCLPVCLCICVSVCLRVLCVGLWFSSSSPRSKCV